MRRIGLSSHARKVTSVRVNVSNAAPVGGGREEGYPYIASCTPGSHTIPAYTRQYASLGAPCLLVISMD